MSKTLPVQVLRWYPQADRETLHQAALTAILAAATMAIAERGRFLLVLAGGETPRSVYHLLSTAAADWAAWHIYFGDERCLPADNAGRNSRMAGEAWLDQVPIPASQVHPIPAELGARAGAAAYSATLKRVKDFDLVLLGLGEDGHTASLFPGQGRGSAAEEAAALPVFNAPQPPAQRVSLAAGRLSRTRHALFLIDGRGKRQAMAAWRAGQDIPARLIAPPGGVDVLVLAALLPDV